MIQKELVTAKSRKEVKTIKKENIITKKDRQKISNLINKRNKT